MATMLIPMLSTKNEDLPDMDFMVDNMNTQDPEMTKQIMESFMKGAAESNNKLRDALLDAIRLGYL